MIFRIRPQRLSRLLAGTALVTMTALSQSSFAMAEQGKSGAIIVAQAPPGAEQKPEERGKPPQRPPQQRPAAPAAPHPQPPAAAQPPRPPAPPTAQQPQRPPAPAAQEHREQRRPGPPPQAPAAQQPTPQAPAVQQQQRPATPPAAQRPQPQAPATAQQPQGTPAPTVQERREERRDQRRPGQPPQAPTAQQPAPQAPAAQQQQNPRVPPAAQRPQPQAPATAQQPQGTPAPTVQERRDERRDQRRPGQPPQAPTAQQPVPQQAPGVVQRNPGAIAPPTQTRDAREFIRRDAQGPAPKMDDIRKSRQEVREGNRTIIREGDRSIVRENNTTIIRHSETNRFVINAANVRTEQRGGNTETIVQRNGGYNIVNITDPNGQLLRRVRRDQGGREIVIIDNSFAGSRPVNMFVQLPEPVIRIPRERYIVEMGRARPDDIYGVFAAPPIEALAERYTLDQVRYSAPLRDRMPRVDLAITFETGSWQLGPDQVDKLSVIADGINRALQRNPREVFMIEGYTDATGSPDDNLSLSDRRAESVAVALTEQFNVPPENLVTQGYGAQFLKVDTDGPEEANRRVAVRRITPLIDGQAAR